MRKTGLETFHCNERNYHKHLLDFWQWFGSDLLSNALRGILAEFIVACDLGCADTVRQEWSAYDLKTSTGFKVEVKSAAYLQSWHQRNPTLIRFGIAPTYEQENTADGYWKQSNVLKRQADVYVFCILSHLDSATVDPLNMAQWKFYVLSARELDRVVGKQKSISLAALLKLQPRPARYGQLANCIDEVMNSDSGDHRERATSI